MPQQNKRKAEEDAAADADADASNFLEDAQPPWTSSSRRWSCCRETTSLPRSPRPRVVSNSVRLAESDG